MPQKPDKVMPALYGGIILGLLAAVPFLNFVNCLCCAGYLFGGFMSVYFYKKSLTAEMSPLTSGDGVQLGALAGVFGGIVSSLITAVLLFTIGNVAGEMIGRMIINLYSQMGILDRLPPDAVAQLEQSMKGGGLSPLTIISSFIISIIFGLLGGLIGYAVFKQKGGTAPQQPPATTV